jgi:hypothetical protein
MKQATNSIGCFLFIYLVQSVILRVLNQNRCLFDTADLVSV